MEAATAERPAGVEEEESHLPGEDPAEDGEVYPEPTIEGDGQLSLSGVGGKKPTSATVKLRGKKIEVEGQLEKGSIVVLRIACRVGGVHFDDTIDTTTDEVTGCDRSHVLRIRDVQRLRDEE